MGTTIDVPKGSSRSRYERSAATGWIVELLRTVAVGEVVTFERLSEAARMDVRKHRSTFTSAARIALREHGLVFSSQRGVGYKRVSEAGKIDVTGEHIVRARNAARSGVRVSRATNVTELSAADRLRHAQRATVAALMEGIGTQRGQRALDNVSKSPDYAAQLLESLT